MKIGIVIFDAFTDLDFALPWDLLNRVRLLGLVPDWQVDILGDAPSYLSVAGLRVATTQPYAHAAACDAVLFCSGREAKNLADDQAFLLRFSMQASTLVAGIDSGALILGGLGLLTDMRATTYPTAFTQLSRYGAHTVEESFVAVGRIATASRCLSSTPLALWMIERLAGKDVADRVFATVRPLGSPDP